MKYFITRERITGAVSFLAGAVVCFLSSGLPKSKVAGDIGSSAFPLMAAVILMICGLGLMIKKPQDDQKPFLLPKQWGRVATLYGSYVIVCIMGLKPSPSRRNL